MFIIVVKNNYIKELINLFYFIRNCTGFSNDSGTKDYSFIWQIIIIMFRIPFPLRNPVHGVSLSICLNAKALISSHLCKTFYAI